MLSTTRTSLSQTGASSFLRFKFATQKVGPLGPRAWGPTGLTPVRPTGPGTRFPDGTARPGPAPVAPFKYYKGLMGSNSKVCVPCNASCNLESSCQNGK